MLTWEWNIYFYSSKPTQGGEERKEGCQNRIVRAVSCVKCTSHRLFNSNSHRFPWRICYGSLGSGVSELWTDNEVDHYSRCSIGLHLNIANSTDSLGCVERRLDGRHIDSLLNHANRDMFKNSATKRLPGLQMNKQTVILHIKHSWTLVCLEVELIPIDLVNHTITNIPLHRMNEWIIFRYYSVFIFALLVCTIDL